MDEDRKRSGACTPKNTVFPCSSLRGGNAQPRPRLPPTGRQRRSIFIPSCSHDSDKLVGPTCQEVGTLEAHHRVGIQTVNQGRHPYRSTPGLVRRLQ